MNQIISNHFSLLHSWYIGLFADLDECQSGEHNCDVNSYCNNTFGSFNCTCLQGYVGDGVHCSGKAAFFFFYFVLRLSFSQQKMNRVLLYESNNI